MEPLDGGEDSMKPRHRQLYIHLERFIDRARWPDYVMNEADFRAYLAHESTGRGAKPAPLAWCKKAEEITVHMLWSEMAEMWAFGHGWFYALHHTMSCEWRERRGSNVWMKKLISIARGIRRRGFMDAMLSYTGFSDDDRSKYLARRFPLAS